MDKLADLENYLRESGYRILEAARENIFISDVDGKVFYFNPAAEQTTGFTLEELFGENISAFYEDKGVSGRVQEDIAMTGRPRTYEAIMVDKSGGRRIFSVKKAPLFNDRGRLVGFLAVSRDVTRARLYEEELRAMKEFNEAVLNSAEDMITVIDREGMFTYFNPAAERISGYKKDEVLGQGLGMLYKDGTAALDKLDEIAERGKALKYEAVIIDKAGRERILSINNAPLYDDDHTLTGFTATSRDVTDSRIQIEEIRSLKEFNEAILNSAHDLVAVTDLEGRITYMNRKAEEMMEYTLEELKGRDIRITYADPGLSDEKLEYIKATGEANNYRAVIVSRSGKEYIIDVKKAPLHDASGQQIGFAAISREITGDRGEKQPAPNAQTTGFGPVRKSMSSVRVKDIMSPAPYPIRPTDTVAHAAGQLIQDDLPALPVVGEANEILGIITMKKLMELGLYHDIDLAVIVDRVMTDDYLAVSPEDMYYDVSASLVYGDAPLALVTEGRHLRGIVTTKDLFRARGLA